MNLLVNDQGLALVLMPVINSIHQQYMSTRRKLQEFNSVC